MNSQHTCNGWEYVENSNVDTSVEKCSEVKEATHHGSISNHSQEKEHVKLILVGRQWPQWSRSCIGAWHDNTKCDSSRAVIWK